MKDTGSDQINVLSLQDVELEKVNKELTDFVSNQNIGKEEDEKFAIGVVNIT
jgi:hypothetical protein